MEATSGRSANLAWRRIPAPIGRFQLRSSVPGASAVAVHRSTIQQASAWRPAVSSMCRTGYGNARVHRFTAAGDLVQSWGQPGSGPGEFRTRHHVAVARDGRVLICDRQNDRIQIFTPEGEFIDEWTEIQRP